jgi:prepilin-type N-terminal cleavage/methylation domain-containing protein
MIAATAGAAGRSRHGFTMIELMVASFLVSLLFLVLMMSWKTFGVPAMEVEARARLSLSANLAAESLAKDLGGYQVLLEGKSGSNDVVQVYRLYKFDSLDTDVNRSYPLRIRFKREDQATNPVTLTVSYYVNSETNTLVRLVEESESSTTVATHIKSLEVTASNVINVTVSYKLFEGVFSLQVSLPQ